MHPFLCLCPIHLLSMIFHVIRVSHGVRTLDNTKVYGLQVFTQVNASNCDARSIIFISKIYADYITINGAFTIRLEYTISKIVANVLVPNSQRPHRLN